MKQTEYVRQPEIQQFISWLTPLLDTPGEFKHEFEHRKPRFTWACDSLFSAYKNYRWTKDAAETAKELNGHSLALKKSVAESDSAACLMVCHQILKWGGVTRSNLDRVRAKHTAGELILFFKYAEMVLAADQADEANPPQIEMNTGFTKLYALLLPDFIIYDSRVGAALGLLVRKHCEQLELGQVPDSLKFAYATGKTSQLTREQSRRDPSTAAHRFPKLNPMKPTEHTRHNLRANWLLGEVLRTTRSEFNREPNPLRALEAALFMIGYQVTEPVPVN